MSHGVQQTKEALKAIEVLGVAAKKISADGKVNLADLPHLIELGQQAHLVVAGVDGLEEIPAEIKDLSHEEAIELVTALYATLAAIKGA